MDQPTPAQALADTGEGFCMSERTPSMTVKRQNACTPKGLLNSSIKEIDSIRPRNPRQEEAFRIWGEREKNLFLDGPAGTGKTFLGLVMAFRSIMMDKDLKHLKIIRSAVPTRDIGFLPGRKEEKESEYEAPYRPLVNQMFGRGDAYDVLEKGGIIQFTTTSHLRGMNFDQCVLLIDEAQNMTRHELLTTLTRVGDNVRIILCGDINQSDLSYKEESGYDQVRTILMATGHFHEIVFGVEDIERSGFVRELYRAMAGIGKDGLHRTLKRAINGTGQHLNVT